MRRRLREEDEVGELNIVPYLDIVTNLVMFMLLSTVGLISLGVLDVGTPRIGRPDASVASATPDEAPLNLTVGISDRGFYVAGSGGVLPGDTGQQTLDTSRPPTLAKRGAEHDYAGLTKLLASIKDAHPKESRVILVAENDTPYDLIIHTMDACRELREAGGAEGAQPRKLFPEVWLSTMKQ
jgi:biopolymer transport protein TolR